MTAKEIAEKYVYGRHDALTDSQEVKDMITDIEEYAKKQVKLLATPAVARRSEQLVCPFCKSLLIEVRHREQSFKCKSCKEGWAE